MGYNTTVIVMNDALDAIKKDPMFGKTLADSVTKLVGQNGPIDVPAYSPSGRGVYVNAATAIETHHADIIKMIAVGGNFARDLGYVGFWNAKDEDLLRQLADSMGYRIVKKPQVGKPTPRRS